MGTTQSSSDYSDFDSNKRDKARKLLTEFDNNKSELINEYFQINKNLSVLKLDNELLKKKEFWSNIEREAKINYLIEKGNFDKEEAIAYVNGLENSYEIYTLGGKNNNTKRHRIKKNKNKNKKTKRRITRHFKQQ